MRIVIVLVMAMSLSVFGSQSAEAATSATKTSVKIGTATFTLKLANNDTAAAFRTYLHKARKLKMKELNGNEKYRYLAKPLPSSPKKFKKVRAGDVMLYGDDCLVIFYKAHKTSYKYTRIGKLTSAKGLARAVGKKSVKVRFSKMKQVKNSAKGAASSGEGAVSERNSTMTVDVRQGSNASVDAASPASTGANAGANTRANSSASASADAAAGSGAGSAASGNASSDVSSNSSASSNGASDSTSGEGVDSNSGAAADSGSSSASASGSSSSSSASSSSANPDSSGSSASPSGGDAGASGGGQPATGADSSGGAVDPDDAQETTSLAMTVNGEPVDVTWEDNASVEALMQLAERSPVEIRMSGYGGFEQFGEIGASLPSDDVRITTAPGDIVLYTGNQMVLFYGSNTWSYTRLGKIAGKTDAELKSLLGQGDVVVAVSLQRSTN